jgi:Holliday junction resolvasome RuvABC DNA-binding subunit
MRGRLLKENQDASSPYSDIIKALSDMGFDYRKAAKAVTDIAEEPDITALDRNEKEKVILKKAIIALSS